MTSKSLRQLDASAKPSHAPEIVFPSELKVAEKR
jgi:hypothetical protein